MSTSPKYRRRKYAFGIQVQSLRTKAGLTQSALAEQIGVHLRSVQNWEAGESYPKAHTLQRLITTFLEAQVFTPGYEQSEAMALWEIAAADSAHALAPFDEGWFAQAQAASALAQVSPDTRLPDLQSTAGLTSSLIDWGEAAALPTLYGRTREQALLYRWAVEERCRVISLAGPIGVGKSSLALSVAQQAAEQFELVFFCSLQAGPPLAVLIQQLLQSLPDPQGFAQSADGMAQLIELFRQRRCLLIIDHLEAILQPPSGAYAAGYTDYSSFFAQLGVQAHQSCLIVASRRQPKELGLLEGQSRPVRSLTLTGLDEQACAAIFQQRGVAESPAELLQLAQRAQGLPLSAQLLSAPSRTRYAGSLAHFYAQHTPNLLGELIEQHVAELSPLEQSIMAWLAIERRMISFSTLISHLGTGVSKGALLSALDALLRRQLIQQATRQPAFTLQPALLEHMTSQLIERSYREILMQTPALLEQHALALATGPEHQRLTQERLLAMPLLQRLTQSCGDERIVVKMLRDLIELWRKQPQPRQGYGPGNVLNLLRLIGYDLRQISLANLFIRQAYLQGVDANTPALAQASLQDTIFAERLQRPWFGW